MTDRQAASYMIDLMRWKTRSELLSHREQIARNPNAPLAGRLYARAIVRELVARNLGEAEEPEEDDNEGEEWKGC